MLELEQPIVGAIQFLPSKDMVVLDDSDEEANAESIKILISCVTIY